jgi:membrane-bound lytic murein transglycosylase D
MPYSTPRTKARAEQLIAQSNRRNSRSNSLILLLGLPFALYLGLFLASPSYVRTTVHPFLQNLGQQVYQFANQWMEDQAVKNEPLIEQAKEEIQEHVAPIIKSLNPTDVVAATGEDAVFGENLRQEFSDVRVTPEMVLSDYDFRVPKTFDVPENLRKRVGFWLSIYSVYSSRFHIIHHVDYPWIIYKIVDITPIAEGPGNKWTRYHKAEKFVDQAVQKVRQDLRKLSLMKNYDNINEEQRRYLELASTIPGKTSKVLSYAASNVRVQLGQKDFFKMGLIRASKYLPKMEEIFAQYDLPVELTRLPLVESSFNDKAVSKVGASGIWQFMPSIGKHYMKINETIDERNSPLKATEGAAKLMLSNRRITNQWPFAITAYNHGPGGIIKASKKLRTNDLAVIIDKYNSKSFGFASSNFYTSFLAALHAERYQEEIFGDIPKYPPHENEEIRLDKPYKTNKLVSILGITYEELKLYNIDLRAKSVSKGLVLPKGYRLFLPPGRKARLELYAMDEQASAKSRNTRRNPPGPKRIQITFEEEPKKPTQIQPETESL